MKSITLVLTAVAAIFATSTDSHAQRRIDQRYMDIDGPNRNQRKFAPKQAPNQYHQKNYNDPRYRRHPSGGNVYRFDQRYRAQAASGHFWRITSDCASACTIGFGHFPKDRMCIARNVRLGFHHGDSPAATAVMWNSYPGDVKALINARGDLKPEWLWIPASAFYQIGYRRC